MVRVVRVVRVRAVVVGHGARDHDLVAAVLQRPARRRRGAAFIVVVAVVEVVIVRYVSVVFLAV